MKVLLVYPKTPTTFWSFSEALKFISKKAAEPPLGLITVAAMLPKNWEKKLIDLNVTTLTDKDLLWADFVFLSGMDIHINSFREIVKRCNKLGVKVVAGGPLATTQYKNLFGVDHFILNEAEITLPKFLKDLEDGKPEYIYKSDEFPDVSLTPIPMFELLEIKKYASMSVQYSRGCPYDCEFCSITMLNGRKPRTKSAEQFINELNHLLKIGYKGAVSVVDDNFIGNKRKIKTELLPKLIEWSKQNNYPFNFITEVSINLADDDELINMMIEAGFDSIFIGIETPNLESLNECGKSQNLRRNMIDAIKKLQQAGFIVSGGFIVGFDNDKENIFEQQFNFIQRSGITNAMVGLLNAPTGTKLWKRLKEEGRLIDAFTGNNMDTSINFIPKMNYKILIRGYINLLNKIYSQKEYFNRIIEFLKNYRVPKWKSFKITAREIQAFIRLIWFLGVVEKERKYFWKLLILSIIKFPQKITTAMTLAVYGYHFRKLIKAI